MRFISIAGIALLALSTAALAQVTRTTTEQKNAPANAVTPGNDSTAANDAAPSPAPANTSTVNDTDAKTEPATPRR